LAAYRLSNDGMEVALTIPAALSICLLWEQWPYKQVSSHRAALIGLGSSVVILSRLDSIVLILLLLIQWLALGRRNLSRLAANLGWFGVGGLALPAYLIANVLVFGGVLPISGAAKQL